MDPMNALPHPLFVEKIEFQRDEIDFQIKFQTLMTEIENTDWRKNLKKYINFYNLHIYKLETMNPKSIRGLYYKLKDKYLKITNQHNRIYWFQNQLKIFVWLLVVSDQYFEKTLDSYSSKQIQYISKPFFKINEDLCEYQFKLLTCLEFDEHWDNQENFLLSELAKKYDFNCSWTTISKELFLDSGKKYLRTAHSCRQKWQNHLDSRLVKGNWTLEDDYFIMKNRVSQGKKWSQIAKMFGPTRTEHMIKNRFKVILKRQSNKKEIRSIEQFQICQQIERKLFQKQKLLANTIINSSTCSNSSPFESAIKLEADVIKVQEQTNIIYVKQGQFKPTLQGLESVQTLNVQNQIVLQQQQSNWAPTFSQATPKLEIQTPFFVQQEYIQYMVNGNLMEEPKIQFFF